MAHLLAPPVYNSALPIFFNVDGVVGDSPARNLREDVLLVQFAFKVAADNAATPTTDVEELMVAAAKAVPVTGSIDAATIKAIRTLQQYLKQWFLPFRRYFPGHRFARYRASWSDRRLNMAYFEFRTFWG